MLQECLAVFLKARERGRGMAAEWMEEEKTLLNIKKLIASVWRMSHQQMRFYCRKLQKNRSKILPGQLGNAFLKKLEWILEQETGAAAKAWPQLMKDAEHLLTLIHTYDPLSKKDWLKALQQMEEQQEAYFQTELGAAFIQDIKEKLGADIPEKRRRCDNTRQAQNDFPTACLNDKKELERIAVWLTKDIDSQSIKPEKKKAVFLAEHFRRAAVLSCACLSACLMCIWLHRQMERNLSQWSLQQMKVPVHQNAEILSVEKPETGLPKDVKALKPDAEEAVKKVKIHSEKRAASKPDKLPQYKKMSKKYPQLYGWLQIPQTQIDYPVMRAQGDRDFYLNHDFSGAESAEGALFVDEKNNTYPLDSNTVIYGHNMKNGHVFGTLKRYTDEEFFREHKEIRFDTIYETGIYEVVAILKTRILNENEQGFRYYQFFQYDNEEEFKECLDFVEKNRIFETGSMLQYGDHLLMLSTCEYSQENGRLVVVARRK